MSSNFAGLVAVDPVELHRRTFMELIAQQMLGVSVMSGAMAGTSLWPAAAFGAPGAGSAAGKAKNVIFLRMSGAMSHIDTFDPKPGVPEGGETKAISTSSSGIQIGEHLPGLAKHADKLAIVRSITTSTADHRAATYVLQTSYRQLATIRHPAMGAFANKVLGLRKKTLPDYVTVGLGERHPGAGYLEPEYTPVPIGNADAGLSNTSAPDYLKGGQLNQRLKLVDQLGGDFRKKYDQKQVSAYGDYYKKAVELMGSKDLAAFDLDQEKDAVRDKYGRNSFGQGVLLARRLVQEDVRWIEVTLGKWDMHNDIYDELPGRCSMVDKAMSALLEDLKSSGLLKSTLIVLGTEFGRKPGINDRGGRDHHPGVFSMVLGGAGIQGGATYGTSDKRGHSPEDDAVTVADFNATIAAAMGIPLEKEIFSKSGRPFKIANDGKAISKILS